MNSKTWHAGGEPTIRKEKIFVILTNRVGQKQTTVAENYGGPQLSHQLQSGHMKNKILTSNTNCSHQILNCSHQKQIAYIKNKLLTSKTKSLQQIQNPDI